MKTKSYRVESTWMMHGVQWVDAESEADAINVAQNASLPAEQEYTDESFEVTEVKLSGETV